MERRLEDIDFSKEAKDAVESNGIVFLDEIDKVSTAVRACVRARVCVCVCVCACVCVFVCKWGQGEQEGALCMNTHTRSLDSLPLPSTPNVTLLSSPCLPSFLHTHTHTHTPHPFKRSSATATTAAPTLVRRVCSGTFFLLWRGRQSAPSTATSTRTTFYSSAGERTKNLYIHSIHLQVREQRSTRGH